MNVDDKAAAVLEALGGKDNLLELDSCITRLRVVLADVNKVDDKRLRQLGAFGVIRLGQAVQVVFGPAVQDIERAIGQMIGL